jgi:fructose-1,6-bisphosphatase I
MAELIDLESFLKKHSETPLQQAVADAVLKIADAGRSISDLLSGGLLTFPMNETTGKRVGVDMQKKIDVIANDIIQQALQQAPVEYLSSEELDQAVELNRGGPLAVAIDPIDGSSNVSVNASVGTIFSILPSISQPPQASFNQAFMQPGSNQLAAAFFVYGPQTALVLTLGKGVQIFTLDRHADRFMLTDESIEIPRVTSEYSVNTSNFRRWDEPYRTYISDCNRGVRGPRNKDFNMRWTASPVADIYRILKRGGIFLYPADMRPGYREGRLRLVYEANPFGLIIEQAGGAASTGSQRILDVQPTGIHQHIPIVAGSLDEVEYVIRLQNEPFADGERSPLFRRRGLFRS